MLEKEQRQEERCYEQGGCERGKKNNRLKEGGEKLIKREEERL